MLTFSRMGALVLTLTFGVMAGFFYAFSVTVMPGLDLRAASEAEAAMRAINEAVRNGVFFATFFGPVPFGAAVTVAALMSGRRRAAALTGLATLIYAGGVVAVTASINVPMNEALAAGSLDWADYSPDWTYWSHVRGALALAAAVLAALGWRAAR